MKKLVMAGIVLAAMGCAFLFLMKQERTNASSTPMNAPAGETSANAGAEAVPEVVQEAPQTSPDQAPTEAMGDAKLAIKKAAEAKKYLFLFIYEGDVEAVAAAKQAVEGAAAKVGGAAELVFVKRDNEAEKSFVEEYQLNRAPMPIVLALAPNGAITGALFGEKLKDPQLQGAMAGESEQRCMKALQDGKLVFLCAQNGATKSNEAAMKGVNDFKADERFTEFTEVVMLDPAAAVEETFLGKLKIDPKMTEATTAFLAPPGSIVAKVTGATTKDALLASLQTASSGGCGAGGCGPKGCGPKR